MLKEPWAIEEESRYVRPGTISNSEGLRMAEAFGEDYKLTARRIIAAINACAGIETAELEQMPLGSLEHVLREYQK